MSATKDEENHDTKCKMSMQRFFAEIRCSAREFDKTANYYC